jgi:hypothetical protein
LPRHPPTPADFDSISLLRSSSNVQLLRSALFHRSSLLRMPSADGMSHSTVERGTGAQTIRNNADLMAKRGRVSRLSRSAAAIHRHRNPGSKQRADKCVTGELTALVRIEHLRPAVSPQGVL